MNISDEMKRKIALARKIAQRRRMAKKPRPRKQQKPDTSSASEMLTPSEIEELRQAGKEHAAYAQKVWPGLKVTDMK